MTYIRGTLLSATAVEMDLSLSHLLKDMVHVHFFVLEYWLCPAITDLVTCSRCMCWLCFLTLVSTERLPALCRLDHIHRGFLQSCHS